MKLVHESLLASAEAVPGKEAIVDEYTSRTWAELTDDSLRFARLLQDEGLKGGDRVALYLDNTALCASAIFGVLIAGGTFTFVNPQTKAGKLAFILNNSEASFLVAETHSAAIAEAAVAVSPTVRQTFTTGAYRETIASVAPEPSDPGMASDGLAALVYTSGTTGEPKGVMLSHDALVFVIGSIAEYLRLERDDRILSILPLAFTYGLTQLLLAARLGATLRRRSSPRCRRSSRPPSRCRRTRAIRRCAASRTRQQACRRRCTKGCGASSRMPRSTACTGKPSASASATSSRS